MLAVMAKNGLRRGEKDLEVYVMCEIPNNVMEIDGFSDERDEGVMRMISMPVEGARRNGRHSGICGQAPSDYPEFAEFLVKEGDRLHIAQSGFGHEGQPEGAGDSEEAVVFSTKIWHILMR